MKLPLAMIAAARAVVESERAKQRGETAAELQHMAWALTTALSHAEAAKRIEAVERR